MTKSNIIRVISRLKFLSDKSAEEQAQWLDTMNQNSRDVLDLKIAVKDMSARNEELTRKVEQKRGIEDLCRKIAEENDELKHKLQHKEKQIDSVNLRMQTVETELEGGAKIRIQVPKPPMKIETSQFDRQRIMDALNEKR